MPFDGAFDSTVEFEWGRPGSQVVGGLHVVRHSQMATIQKLHTLRITGAGLSLDFLISSYFYYDVISNDR